ncbi:hypothetical protein ACFL54_00125 [Planctomycetota bacterium]
MSGETIAVIVIIGTITAVIAIFIIIAAKRRRAWQTLAMKLGFTLTEDDDSLQKDFKFALLSFGLAPRSAVMLSGTAQGCNVFIGDHAFETESSESTTTHKRTFCVVQQPGLTSTNVMIWPESHFTGFAGKLASTLGLREGLDINFDEDSEFSKAYVVRGDDETSIRSLFDQDLRRYFISHRNQLKACIIEMHQDALAIMPVDPRAAAGIGLIRPDGKEHPPCETAKRIAPEKTPELMEIGIALIRTIKF